MARTQYYEKFITDGIHHSCLPSEWKQHEEDFGVRRHSYLTVDSGRIAITFQAPATSDEFIELRKLHRQAWSAVWSEDSFMTEEMYDHLRTLYTLQKPFWLQFDSEMTRAGAVLQQVGENYEAYFTPTYPIAPYGYDPTNKVGFQGTVAVNGQFIGGGYTVDSELGLVRFNTPLTSSDEVHMSYTWKCFCTISAFNVQPVDVAKGIYEGTVIFEQVKPNYFYDPWDISLLPGLAIGDNTLHGGPSDPSRPTNMITIPWGDTRFFSYGPGRLFLYWWLIRWKRF